MTWENYGTMWSIDRVIPFVKWDLTNPEEAASCYHYTNSTPLFITTRIVDGVEHIGNLNKNKF
jgi:hypothetical protein